MPSQTQREKHNPPSSQYTENHAPYTANLDQAAPAKIPPAKEARELLDYVYALGRINVSDNTPQELNKAAGDEAMQADDSSGDGFVQSFG